ncbi:type IV pilus assembly protein PilM [Fuchsiella alkaliacetigena]|uniref:type IV pilus assembly protein PilM n=1 Tax=Fuchsiella alkaliacetigena TaxID=957042 RepID=UPI00200A26F8|nr:type IV pilus assembly protein PilM [Fuchsiella alkaliacetigena]MCK8825286.1 type IV pilus assembly protein PilM [Fuchsiella alkaliacetigena]
MQIVDGLSNLFQNITGALFKNNSLAFLNKQVIGVDIGSNLIKAVSADLKKEQLIFKNLTLTETPPGVIEKGKLKDLDTLAAELGELLSSNNFAATQIVTAISGEELIIRMLEIPSMPKEELSEAVKWEAQEQLPMSLENVILDYEIIMREENGSYKLMLVAVDRNVIDSYLELFRSLDLKVLAIEIEPLALSRSISFLHPAETLAIIDIGASTTDISVCNQEQLLFTRTINLAANDITEELAENQELDLSAAEKYKQTCNLFAEELGLVIRNLTTTIYRSLDYFQVEFKNYNIERIILTGGGSKLKGFKKHLSNEFGVEVTSLELLDAVEVEADFVNSSIELTEINQFLGVALGLALRGVMDYD